MRTRIELWLGNIAIYRTMVIYAIFWSNFSVAGSFSSGINADIKSAGYHWQAGETGVSGLSLDEKRQLAGIPLKEVQIGENFGRHNQLLENSLPAKWDWRLHDGVDLVAPVKNQGRCGSCVAFAAISTMETQFNISTNSPTLPWSFSPQHLFACGGGSCDQGWMPGQAVDFLNTLGVPDGACFPYSSGALGEDLSCNKSCGDAKGRSFKAALRVRSKPILGASVDEVKQALIAGPVIATMKVFEDFYFYKSGVYRHVKGKTVGGHAVTIVGWSNADQAWIVRNSWGTDWGLNGDFLISWDDRSGIGATFYGLEPDQKFVGISLEGVRDRQFIRGSVSLFMRSHGLKIGSATLEINSPSKAASVFQFDSNGEVNIDSATLSDGIYTVKARARAIDGSGERVSQTYLIFVHNQQATADLQIKRMTPNMNVWEPIVPQFAISSFPVPLAAVRYRVENDQGQTVYSRSAPHTADLLGISLNPGNLSVGHFKLIGEAVSDDGKILASDEVPFNVIEP